MHAVLRSWLVQNEVLTLHCLLKKRKKKNAVPQTMSASNTCLVSYKETHAIVSCVEVLLSFLLKVLYI